MMCALSQPGGGEPFPGKGMRIAFHCCWPVRYRSGFCQGVPCLTERLAVPKVARPPCCILHGRQLFKGISDWSNAEVSNGRVPL